MAVITEPNTTDTPVENKTVEEPKTVETNETSESTETPAAESTTEKTDAGVTTTTTLPSNKDEETAVETPSKTPVKESSKEGEETTKKRVSPTQQPEEHPDAKKIAVQANGDSKNDVDVEALATKDDTVTVAGGDSPAVAEAAEPSSKVVEEAEVPVSLA
jgi:hypothetical protein